MNCPKCGNDMGENNVCSSCRANEEKTTQVDPSVEVQQVTVAPVTTVAPVAEPQPVVNPEPTAKKAKGKKLIGIIVAVVLVVALAVTGVVVAVTYKSASVKECIEVIDEIKGKITVDSEEAILAAEEKYNALSESEKKKVDNYEKLSKARSKYDKLVAAEVEGMISSLSYYSSIDEILDASAAYNKLTEDQQKKVENYEELKELEDSFYDDLINEVNNKISSITYTSGEATEDQKKLISEAYITYNKIGDDYKSKVTDYAKLEKAKSELDKYYIPQAQKLIDDAIANNTGFSVAAEAYEALDEEQKKQITNYEQFNTMFDEFKKKSPVKILSYTIGSNSIGCPELFMSAQNVSDQIIKEFTVSIFAYDESGVPVSLGYGDYMQNLRYGNAVKVGEKTSSNSYWTFYGMYDKSQMKNVVIIVKEVSFFDGSTWENPDYNTLRTKYEQQMIKLDDPNIIKK